MLLNHTYKETQNNSIKSLGKIFYHYFTWIGLRETAFEAPTGSPTSHTTDVVSLEPLMMWRDPLESSPRQVIGAKCLTTDVTILFLAMLKARRLLSHRPP